jgi:hypothetical protein
MRIVVPGRTWAVIPGPISAVEIAHSELQLALSLPFVLFDGEDEPHTLRSSAQLPG